MNTLKVFENIPWNRFSHAYGIAHDIKKEFKKILDRDPDLSSYKFIIDRVEHQDTLWRVTPWALKMYIALLDEEYTDKEELLKSIKIIFEAANFSNYSLTCLEPIFKPTKKMLEKYAIIKDGLFDDEIDAEYWKIYKSLPYYYIYKTTLDYIDLSIPLFKRFTKSENPDVAIKAKELVLSIENPKQYG